MRTIPLLRQEDCAVYEVECRYHEYTEWITEGSRFTEFVYPLGGGFLLSGDTAASVCLPARLVLIPGGASYRIRHFRQLPDRTLVTGIRNPQYAPRRILHLFLAPAEVCGLQLLADSLRTGNNMAAETLSRLLRAIMWRFDADGIPESQLTGRAGRLELSIALMLTSDGAATPEECARAAGCGVHHFRHRFRDTYGTTPHRVVQSFRLARALRVMLEGGTATVAAQIAGFTHLSHLSNEFRRVTGRSPSELLSYNRTNGTREAAALWHCAQQNRGGH